MKIITHGEIIKGICDQFLLDQISDGGSRHENRKSTHMVPPIYLLQII